MADREKVKTWLKGLFKANPTICPMGDCDSCPYFENKDDCYKELRTDALALQKEQEAKKVIKQTYHVMMNRDYENPVEVTRYDWLCPTCKSLLCRDIDMIDDNYHFCKVCGQAVKWE